MAAQGVPRRGCDGEIVRRIDGVALHAQMAQQAVAPGGALIAATINRTASSLALAVVTAEYLLNWLPRGTHDWRKFVRPAELILELRRNGLHLTEIAGLTFDPMTGGWAIARDLRINYIVFAARR